MIKKRIHFLLLALLFDWVNVKIGFFGVNILKHILNKKSEINLSISQLSRGIYFVELKLENSSAQFQKLIVE